MRRFPVAAHQPPEVPRHSERSGARGYGINHLDRDALVTPRDWHL